MQYGNETEPAENGIDFERDSVDLSAIVVEEGGEELVVVEEESQEQIVSETRLVCLIHGSMQLSLVTLHTKIKIILVTLPNNYIIMVLWCCYGGTIHVGVISKH